MTEWKNKNLIYYKNRGNEEVILEGKKRGIFVSIGSTFLPF